MADDLRARIARIRADAERNVHPSWRDINPTWVLLTEIDRLTAEVGAVAKRGAAAIAAMRADVRAARAERDRYRLAWQSARKRAASRRLNGERSVGGPIRQALIDAGIITAEDRVADAVEKIRALGSHPACRHGVLPEQGLCLYCAAENNLPTAKENLS